MPAPASPATMRRLAASIRAHHGSKNSELAQELEAEAARVILGSQPAQARADKEAFPDEYHRLCQLWRSENIPSPTPVRPLYDLAVSFGIADIVIGADVSDNSRLRAFAKWFAAYPHERTSRNGRLWHAIPKPPPATLLPSLIDAQVWLRIQRYALEDCVSPEEVISAALCERWGIPRG